MDIVTEKSGEVDAPFFNAKLNKLLNKARIRDSKCDLRLTTAETLILSIGLVSV